MNATAVPTGAELRAMRRQAGLCATELARRCRMGVVHLHRLGSGYYAARWTVLHGLFAARVLAALQACCGAERR